MDSVASARSVRSVKSRVLIVLVVLDPASLSAMSNGFEDDDEKAAKRNAS
jgi:hypothetical protein